MRVPRSRFGDVAIAVTLMALLWPDSAHAYLDGGTAALLFQALAAALFGALFATKMFWARIKSFFRSLTGSAPNENNPDA